MICYKNQLKNNLKASLNSFWQRSLVILFLSLVATSAWAGKIHLDQGKTVQDAVREARRSGKVQRALRGPLLVKTITGTLHLNGSCNPFAGATIEAETEDEPKLWKGKLYPGATIGINKIASQKVYTIPPDARNTALIKECMDDKTVEIQFFTSEPGNQEVANIRFIGLLRGQGVTTSHPRPSRRGVHPSDSIQSGQAYFVSPDGADSNSGTKNAPFQTIEQGISVLEAGDTLYLREGRYQESIIIQDLKGTAKNPITIKSFPGERAIIDASEDLRSLASSRWKRLQDNIWQLQLKKPIWQLWQDGTMQILCRWPKISKTWTDKMHPLFNGRTPEPGTAWHENSYYAQYNRKGIKTNFKETELDNAYDPDYPFKRLQIDKKKKTRKVSLVCPKLEGVRKSLKGAYIEGLASQPAVITKHEPNSPRLEALIFDFSNKFHPNLSGGRLVIRNHINLLDLPREWCYRAYTKTLYVKMEAGDTPLNHRYRAKANELFVLISGSSNIHLKDLSLLGCRIQSVDSPGTVLENCRISYPTFKKTALIPEKVDKPELLKSHQVKRKTRRFRGISAIMLDPGGSVKNCILEYFDSSGIEINHSPGLIENCLVQYGTRYAIILSRSPGIVVRRNTIHSTCQGGAIRIRKTPLGGFISELNYGYDIGVWRSDASGTQVQSGSQKFHIFRRNWFHHTECKALRFDGQPAGSLGTALENVGWRLWQGIQAKGDYQKLFNNTLFNCSARCDISVVNQLSFGGAAHTITRNNLCDTISGHRKPRNLEGEGHIPGIYDHNWNGIERDGPRVKELLRDPDNFDFRPIQNPNLIDKGTTQVVERFSANDWINNIIFKGTQKSTPPIEPPSPHYTFGSNRNVQTKYYLGKAPDLGAYEYGDQYYWVPGRQEEGASFPIPPDGARHVQIDADLMWRTAKDGTAYSLYFGTERNEIKQATPQSPAYKGVFTESNIFSPASKLKNNQTYFWRVDTKTSSNSIVTGPVWEFTPDKGEYREYTRLDTPEGLEVVEESPGAVRISWKTASAKNLVGYNVYRSENSVYLDLSGTKLNDAPLKKGAITDRPKSHKGVFFYGVEAVDKEGLASPLAGPKEINL